MFGLQKAEFLGNVLLFVTCINCVWKIKAIIYFYKLNLRKMLVFIKYLSTEHLLYA